ncbi:MAG: DUF1598 domain-containing protein [Planctomycetota bacterium]
MLRLALSLVTVLLVGLTESATAQPGGGAGLGNAAGANGLGLNGPLGGGSNGGGQGQGGGANADFDSLIDLIVSTVAPDAWAENGGGAGEVRPFPSGVWLDAGREIETKLTTVAPPTTAPPRRAAVGATRESTRNRSPLRYVSLPRLEAEIAKRIAEDEPLDEAMLTLAGLRRVERIHVVPPQGGRPGDLLVAGPAGDWRLDADRRLVATDTGLAVARLDDLLTLLRREWVGDAAAAFGCSITPRQSALAATQRLLNETNATPLRPGKRGAWLESIRSMLGPQDVEVFGVDPQSNAARVLVEADHHMKQLGLGVVEHEAVDSYMDRVERAMRLGAAAAPLSVLRWWFVAEYDAVERSADGRFYRLRGEGVRVLSENELLSRRGERLHTGEADEPTQGFADDFTENFATLCRAFPVYSELRNAFDLAMVAALVHRDGLAEAAGWRPTLFADRLRTPALRVATEVETLATSRVVRKTQILAAVSGGVWVDPESAERVKTADTPSPGTPNGGVWWWDAR